MADLVLGTVLGGRYRLTRLIGRGGMGEVYEAQHEHLNRRVAVKVLLPELGAESEALARFQREAQIAASLGHPNIVQVIDFDPGTNGQPPYLAMELLAGDSLQAMMKREGALPPGRVIGIARQIVAALGAAHSIGVIHRDVKPDNVILASVPGGGEVAKVLDFGIAKLTDSATHKRLTATGVLVGTPAYMAPEQLSGAALDARTDLYAVGVMMYRALADRAPFVAKSPDELIRAKLQGLAVPIEQVRPEVDPVLASIVMRAMAADPRARFASASDLDRALASWRRPDSIRPDARVPSQPPAPAARDELATQAARPGAAPSVRPPQNDASAAPQRASGHPPAMQPFVAPRAGTPSARPPAAALQSARPPGAAQPGARPPAQLADSLQRPPPGESNVSRAAIYVAVLVASVLLGGGIVVLAIRAKKHRNAAVSMNAAQSAGPSGVATPPPAPRVSPVLPYVSDASLPVITGIGPAAGANAAQTTATPRGSTSPRFDAASYAGCHVWHGLAFTSGSGTRFTSRTRICSTGNDVTGDSTWTLSTGRSSMRFEGSWINDGHAMQIRESAVTSDALAHGARSCPASYSLAYDGLGSLRGSWASPECEARGAVTFRRE